jgi:hypothetical protein
MKEVTNIRWLEEIRKEDIPSVGGKGASLGEMASIGLPVPKAFVVTSLSSVTTTSIEASLSSVTTTSIEASLSSVTTTSIEASLSSVTTTSFGVSLSSTIISTNGIHILLEGSINETPDISGEDDQPP